MWRKLKINDGRNAPLNLRSLLRSTEISFWRSSRASRPRNVKIFIARNHVWCTVWAEYSIRLLRMCFKTHLVGIVRVMTLKCWYLVWNIFANVFVLFLFSEAIVIGCYQQTAFERLVSRHCRKVCCWNQFYTLEFPRTRYQLMTCWTLFASCSFLRIFPPSSECKQTSSDKKKPQNWRWDFQKNFHLNNFAGFSFSNHLARRQRKKLN